MAVSLSTVASEVVAQLNLATSYTSTVSDPRAYTQQITDAVLNADGAVVEAICANPANGQRAAFRTTATVAHGGALPARIGPIDSVVISSKAAVPWDKSEIERERANVLSLTTISPHFAVDGNTLYINTGTATVAYCAYTRGTATCSSPDEYFYPVLCGALAEVASIEGENDGLASFYGAQFQGMLQAIRAGQAPPPFQASA